MHTIHKISLTCKEATCLSLITDEKTIPLFSRARLLLHRLTCPPCRRFMNQLAIISGALANYRESIFSRPPHHLSSEKKQAMQEELDKIS